MQKTKCTVVIPEHNRPLHLKRLLDFYLKYDIHIIVSDSTESEFSFLKDYEEKITYRHYPEMPLAEKINAIGHLITTPFVFMCANDDFIIPETVRKIVSFLEDNNEYDSGQGIYVKFDPLQAEIKPQLIYENMLNEKLDETKSRDRLSHLMGNYFQFYYAVFRTELFTKIYASVIKEHKTVLNNLRLLEIYVSCYAAIESKHIILTELYGARESIFMSAGAVTDKLPQIVKSARYKNEYSAFIKLLSGIIKENEDTNDIESENIVVNAIQLYLESHFPRNRGMKYLLMRYEHIRIISRLKRIVYLFKLKQTPQSIPAVIEGMGYWSGIKQHINDYRFIYK
jgi:glycosyltransferase domain-containing protein